MPDEDIDRPECLDRGVDRLADLVRPRHVTGEPGRAATLAPDCCRRLARDSLIHVDDGHRRSLAGQGHRGRSTNAAPSPGDDDDFSAQSEVHPLLRLPGRPIATRFEVTLGSRASAIFSLGDTYCCRGGAVIAPAPACLESYMRRAMRQGRGLTPVAFLNTVAKWVGRPKPHCNPISITDRSVCANRSQAFSMRSAMR